jgi:hypothetical protein
MLASMPWLQFNQLSLMNANKGAFGVNLEYWDLVRLRGDTGKLTVSDPTRFGASNTEDVNKCSGYGAIYVPGGQQT